MTNKKEESDHLFLKGLFWYKIAFIAPREYSKSMRFAGFECFSAGDKEEAVELIEKLAEKEYAFIFVSQDIAPDDVGLGNVVVLPGMVKKSDSEYLKKEIIKAIGGEINLAVNN